MREGLGPLFEPPPPPPGARVGRARRLAKDSLARTAARNAILLEALTPVALELAREAWPGGITVTDVRKEATKRGILTGYETRHQLSCLGALMRRAGLTPTAERRASDLDSTHARPQLVWTL